MRLPLVPTMLVTLAVAAMVALGCWQLLIRLPEKEAMLAQLAANPSLPAVPFPDRADESLLFRRATLDCGAPVTSRRVGAGSAGYRIIATCAGGQQVQLGTTRDPNGASAWSGGRVTGRISHVPDTRPLIATLFDHAPRPPMLVADQPPPGLARNATPDWQSVPNNHLAYGVQWFLFAGIAAIIYVLAVRRRGRPS